MIYLYIKTHNITGLKYLGKTIKDPYDYKGSGKYWKRHIEKYGYNVTTQILLATESKQDLIDTGIFFSKIWNIVKSNEWANLREESGDGGITSSSLVKTDIHKNNISKSLRSENTNRLLRENNWAKTNPNAQRNHAIRAGKQSRSKMTNEKKIKISESMLLYNNSLETHPNIGLIRVKVECPHCKKLGAKNVMSRFHFDQCRQKS
jgi:hypothetical protein